MKIRSNKNSSLQNVTVSPGITAVTLEELQPFSVYSLYVVGIREDLEGPSSDVRDIFTEEHSASC